MKRIPSWALGALIAAIVVAALVTVVVRGRGPADLPPGSPEAAVQRYLTAVIDRDGEAAVALLEPDTSCTPTDVDNVGWVGADTHVELRTVEVRSSTTARVTVTITTGSGELVPSGWDEEQTFTLRRFGGEWRLTDMPWPLYECGGMTK